MIGAATKASELVACPACTHKHGLDLDFDYCARIRGVLSRDSDAFKSWGPWASMLCAAHSIEWCAALLKEDA